jgi:serine/threonine-protein kinase TTK/MPS1
MPDDPATVGRSQPGTSQGSVSRYGAIGGRKEEMSQSAMRVKRVAKVPGSFLSGPARRGKRRQSEEDAEEHGDGELGSSQERASQQAHDHANDLADHPASSFLASNYRDFAATGSPVSAKDAAKPHLRQQASNARAEDARAPEVEKSHIDLPPLKSMVAPPHLPSAHDKENDIPSSLRRSKAPAAGFVEPELVKPARVASIDEAVVAPSGSPERKALAPKSQNTPHRPAPPPPPKMSVVETATKAAGAAATDQAAKKRAILLRVNNRMYTRIECVGRGGSGKVYRVSAENGHMLALKRVSIEHADEATVRGFKGEIDLLKRLRGVERVIELIDWELNEEKKMLSLVR